MNTGIIRKFHEIISLLEPKDIKRWYIISFLSVIGVFLDLFSLASLLPILLIFFDTSILYSPNINAFINTFWDIKNLTEVKLWLTLCTVIIFALKSIFAVYLVKVKSKFNAEVAKKLGNKILKIQFDRTALITEKFNAGKHVQNFLEYPGKFAFQLLPSTFELASALIMCLFLVIALLVIEAKIFLPMVLLMGPGITGYLMYKKRKSDSIKEEMKVSYPRLVQRAMEVITGHLEIILSQSSSFFTKRFNNENSIHHNTSAKLLNVVNSSNKVMELIALTGICSLLSYLIINDAQPQKAIILLSTFGIASARLLPAINQLSTAYTKIIVHSYVVEGITDIFSDFDNNPTINQEQIPQFKELRIDNVSFKYNDSPYVLNNVSLRLKKGDRLAVMGESGVGKSTLAKIILGQIFPSSGKLSINDREVTKDNLNSWRKQISLVPQSVFIFEGSLLDNITMGKDVSEQEMREIKQLLTDVKLDDFVSQMGGLNGVLGENGNNISAGQKQRIGIVRALWQRKEILICDEITSNLDEENRIMLIETLERLLSLKNTTALIITHDTEMSKLCDKTLTLT